jgi:hypothetical protein
VRGPGLSACGRTPGHGAEGEKNESYESVDSKLFFFDPDPIFVQVLDSDSDPDTL